VKQEGLKERVELLDAGERLGYPRLGYGRSTKIPHDKRIPQGKDGWEKFCTHAHVRRILPALRIARVLRDNNVEVFHPLSGRESSDNVTGVRDSSETGGSTEGRLGGSAASPTVSRAPAPDLLEEIVIARDNTQKVAVYPPGRRRHYPSKKNKPKVASG
jgi:hypothetical protein